MTLYPPPPPPPLHFDNFSAFDQQQPSEADLAQSVILVPEHPKYPTPTSNLESIFRAENMSLIKSLISTLSSSAARTRDAVNTKSADLLRAMPKTQSLHVVIGVLVVYYALPNSVGFTIVKRLFDLVIMKNILLLNSWNMLFEYMDDSSGSRHSVVPL